MVEKKLWKACWSFAGLENILKVMMQLARGMFNAAGVPEQTRNEYFELFDLFCLGE